MPTPRLDDANIEFAFNEQEALIAQILDPMKIMWFQTKYAQYWKMKNSMQVPESADLDRSYFVKMAELDGRLNALQEIMDNHKSASAELAKQSQQSDQTSSGPQTDALLAERAAAQVHRIPHN